MTIDDCIRDVVGYEGKYKINIVGEVFNKKGKQLKPCVDKFWYLKCCLYDGKSHQKKIHRMVAEAFIPNPLSKEQVNHIDGNKKNNCADNLEWCCRKYNCNYGARNSKISEYQKLRHKMNKIEYLLDSCIAYPDDMCDCLVQIEKVVKE